MQEIIYEKNYQIEDSYWWFIAKFRIMNSIIRKYVPTGRTILDVGCGTGGFAAMMQKDFDMICLDTSQTALGFCRKRGLEKQFNGLLSEYDYKSNPIDAITMLDVVEHIEDDEGVLRNAFEILPEGGVAFITVPAYQWLWSFHDVIHMHYRRYSRRKIIDVARRAGFSIEYSSYFNSLLFAPSVLKRIIDRVTKKEVVPDKDYSPVEILPQWMNSLLTKIFMFESKLMKFTRLPFGLSIIVIARKGKP